MNNNFDMKQTSVIEYMRKNKDIGITQGDITRALKDELFYASEDSARVSIGKIMSILEERGAAHFIERKSKRGSISSKVWYLGPSDEFKRNLEENRKKLFKDYPEEDSIPTAEETDVEPEIDEYNDDFEV